MYLPKLYQVTDEAVISKFIQQNSFATLVSCDQQTPVATHLPLEVVQTANGNKFLRGHVSRANQHWQTFHSSNDVLAIFSGPHTYVSARWYNHLNVPTWNYMVVHVYGKPRLITEQNELYAMLKQLVDKYETNTVTDKPYKLETLPPEYVKKEMRGIVGFEIKIERCEAKFKLSQNRQQQDYDNVIAELQKSGNSNALAIAQAMAENRTSLYGD